MSLWTDFRDTVTAPFREFIDWITPDPPEVPQPEPGVLLNVDGADRKIPIVYGERRVGGIRVFKGVSGATNEFLHVLLVLCEGPISSVGDVYIDDVISTDPKFAGLVTITKYTGTATQVADPGLVAAFANWTPNHRLLGTAYIHVKLQWQREVFRGFPKITAQVWGRKVFDPRLGSALWSQNPALCLADYLTDPVAGAGLDPTAVPDASIAAAADICEQQIPTYLGSGATMDQFAVNGVVDTSKKVIDNVRSLLGSCRGLLPFTEGEYRLVIERDEVPVFTFTEDNILGGWDIQGSAKSGKLNRVKIRYTNPARNWQPDEAIEESTTWLTEDNGLLLERDVSYPFETDPYRARYHAEVILKKSREGLTVGFVATLSALSISIGDVVAVTHPTPGWVDKTFRVLHLQLFTNGNVGVQLREHDPTAYDRTVPVGLPAAPDTNLPDPFTVAPPTGLVLTSGTNDLVINSAGSIVSRIRATWVAAADAFVSDYEVQFKRSDSAMWIPAGSGEGTEVYLSPVEDGIGYDVRVRSVNTLGIPSPWVTVLGHVVIGKTAPPLDPTTIVVTRLADGTRKFYVYLPDPMDPDYDGVLIRYMAGGGGTWAMATPLNVGPIRAFPYETSELPAGTYRFFAKTVDTTGNQSVNAVNTGDIYLGDPPLKNVYYQQHAHDNGWNGTLVGCALNGLGELEALDDGSTTWAGLTSWDAYSRWTTSPVGSITYEDVQIDLGVAMTFTPIVSAAGDGSPVYEVRSKVNAVDPWSAWQAPTLLTGIRHVQARVVLTGVFPILCTMTTVIDVEVETEVVTGLAVTTDSLGYFTYTITKNFAVVSNAPVTSIIGVLPLISVVSSRTTTAITYRVFWSSTGAAYVGSLIVDLKIEGPKG